MKFLITLSLATVIGLCVFFSLKVSANENQHLQSICLAKNMYYEARNQGTAGLFAVAAVVFNRVNDSRFPNTICEVVQQGPIRASWKRDGTYYPIKNKCQFSWYCDGKSDEPKELKKYQMIFDIADSILTNELSFIDITDGAVFYHADYVTPGWAKTKHRTIEIEDHIFYTWNTNER
jgi:spore germination cell wall hydrolase CwlJ-like protein